MGHLANPILGGMIANPILNPVLYRLRRFPQLGLKGNTVRPDFRFQAVAVPATVSGELAFHSGHWATGKAERPATTRQPGDLPSQASPGRRTGVFGGTVLRFGDAGNRALASGRLMPFALKVFSASHF